MNTNKKNNVQIKVWRNRPIAFQASPFMKLSISAGDVWIDCPTCDLSIVVNSDYPISDEEFITMVEGCGWILIPGKKIICPECQIREEEENENK